MGQVLLKMNYYRVFRVYFLLLFLASVAQADTSPPFAEWYMDETSWNGTPGEVKDNSGNSRDGVARNGATTVPGKLCRGGDFSAGDDYVAVGSDPIDLGLGGKSAMTVASWVKWTIPLTSSKPHANLLTYTINGDEGVFWLQHNVGNTAYEFALTTTASRKYVQSSVIPQQDTWQHVVGVYDGAKLMIYVNGVLSKSVSHSGTIRASGAKLSIGRWTAGVNNYRSFTGYLDEQKIFDRALDAADVKAMYENENTGKNWNGTARTCPAVPLAEYRFEGCDWSVNAPVTDETGRYPGIVVEGAKAEPGTDYGNGGLCNVANLLNEGTDYKRHVALTGNPIPLTTDWTLMMWVNFPLSFVNHAKFGNYRYTALAGGTSDLCWLRKREGRTDISWGASSTPDAHVRDFPDTLTGWHHLGFVGAGSTTSLYVDGVFLNTTDYKQTGLFNRIGSTSDPVTSSARQNIDSQIDEVKFYNSPLPATQITSIYDNEINKKNWDGTARSCLYCGAVDHYEIIQDGSALICVPEDVQVVACADTGCTTLSTTPVAVTLLPTGWVGGDTVSFSGTTNVKLRHTIPETVTLGMNAQLPLPINGYRCVRTRGGAPVSCDMSYYGAGFDFDIPTQTSCKESGDITISAVGLDPLTSLCGPLFVNQTVDVSFWSLYVDPNTGSRAVRVKGNLINGASPGTPVPLAFDANGQSRFKIVYSDAGLLQLNARYVGAGIEAGLEMLGNDSFVTAPAGLCVYSDAANSDCASGDAACSVFAKAGDPFALKVKGVCWQSDGESNAQFCDNATTANFRMNNIGLTHTLVAPTTGVAGNIAISSANITTAGVVAVQQVVSEVGVFTFKADPPIDYLGAGDVFAGATFASVNIGRFIPDHFAISLLPNPPGFSDECGVGSSAFTYLGQPFNWALIPALTISAMNAVGTVTHNYEGAFWKLTDPLASYTYVDANAPVSLGPLTPETSAQSLPPTINCDGVVTVPLEELTEFNYTRPPAASPVSPFVPDVALSISQASLTDTDSVCYKQGALPGCRGFVVEDITGTHMRHGQIKIFNNFGPETTDIISSPFEAQYYNGIKWLVNVDDTCTTGLSFCPSARVFAVQPVPLIAGKGTLTVSKPDSVIVCPTAPNWLTALADCTVPDSSCGEFTFGIYRGNDRIINWQEIMQ